VAAPPTGILRAVVPVATVLVLGLLLVALAVGVAPNLDTRVVQLGEQLWPGYASELRADPLAPACDLAALEARAAACTDAPAAPPDAPAGDPFAEPDPFADRAAPSVENCEAIRNLAGECRVRHDAYTATQERLTGSVLTFRSVEQRVSGVAKFGYTKHLLVLLVLLGALATTTTRMHIGLRTPHTVTEHRAGQLGELAAHLFWLASNVADWRVQHASAAEPENQGLPILWSIGFGLLALVNVRHLWKPPPDLSRGPTTVPRLLMVLPLYVYMAVVAGVWFTLVESHPSGQAIYLHKFVQYPTIYLGVGLYVWAGMLLAQTRVARLAFGVARPFHLPAAILAWIVVVLSALPTAYSGASGIFVIATGAVIFEQLREAGASPRMALATTAMSGSLGVVLRPCLLVVLIAVLNKQVTTAELYGHGFRVFLLTSALSLVAYVWWNPQPFRRPDFRVALPAAGQALLPLLPYAGIAAAVVLFYAFALQTYVNEHTAPLVLPVVLLAVLLWDRLGAGTTWPALTAATSETAAQVGALLVVMCASVALGGVVERSDLMSLVPASLGSAWIAMTVLVVVMVLVGMTMDAFGAVVLVSVTIARVAYENGIDPVHFWMMVLVGFELGYLTPPVALNQLLARQVVGEAGAVERTDPQVGFFARYSHVIVPCAIMGVALLVVAYVPLFFY
jgi:TRAP-type C4-dicarboxylate transport system permease large subunit